MLDHYRAALAPKGWRMFGDVERTGVATYCADWVSGDHRLRVSATPEPQLGGDVPSDQVTVQYSLTLRPA